MAEYIEREAAMNVLVLLAWQDFNLSDSFQTYLDALKDADIQFRSLPAADVKPVVRGEWRHKKNKNWQGGGVTYCSVCRYGFSDGGYHAVEEHFRYCPACGADMRGDKD